MGHDAGTVVYDNSASTQVSATATSWSQSTTFSGVNDLVFGLFSQNGTQAVTWSAGSGYTSLLSNPYTSGGKFGFLAEYQANMTSSPAAVTATAGTTMPNVSQSACTFRIAPALSISPTSATVALGGTQSFTPTLANSSASLTASATHGTITGSVVSGTPFTYTAPASGTSDTVTVTDFTDSLTAPASITLTSTPTLSISPTSATVVGGQTHSFTPTLINSSATLTASATYGSITGSIASGSAFTYTAPSTGHTSDTVTVTDFTDSLTAPASITVTPLATSFTLAAPSPASGSVGVASGNFTVTPNGPYTGTITLTPSGDGLSTPVVLTFSGSASPQSTTFTPTAAGTLTVTPTNNGSLTNPSAVTYAAMSATIVFASVSGFASGQSVGYTVLSTSLSSILAARTTSGVSSATDNGNTVYTATISLPTSSACIIRWDDGLGHYAYASA